MGITLNDVKEGIHAVFKLLTAPRSLPESVLGYLVLHDWQLGSTNRVRSRFKVARRARQTILALRHTRHVSNTICAALPVPSQGPVHVPDAISRTHTTPERVNQMETRIAPSSVALYQSTISCENSSSLDTHQRGRDTKPYCRVSSTIRSRRMTHVSQAMNAQCSGFFARVASTTRSLSCPRSSQKAFSWSPSPEFDQARPGCRSKSNTIQSPLREPAFLCTLLATSRNSVAPE